MAVQKLHCVKPLRVQNLHCVGLYSLGTLCKNRTAVSRYIVILYFRYTVQKLHLYTICCHTIRWILVNQMSTIGMSNDNQQSTQYRVEENSVEKGRKEQTRKVSMLLHLCAIDALK